MKNNITAREALARIKSFDPNSDLTLTAIRSLINCGKIDHIQMGKKKLININDLINYFSVQ